MRKINKKYGILFLFTGLPGTGKTTLGKRVYGKIKKLFGPTLIFNGDDIRNIFEFKKYSKEERLKLNKKYANFIEFVIKQKVNLIFTTVSLSKNDLSRRLSKNTIFVHLKANYKTRYKFKKKVYKLKKNIPGKDIPQTTPKYVDFIIENNLNKKLNKLESEFWIRLKKEISF